MSLSMDRWIGKVAIVTGASAGIGANIAEQLVESGLKVAGLARRLKKLEELKKKLSNKKGQFYPIKTDISKEEDILAAFKYVKEHLGPVSILINNAGIVVVTDLTNGVTELWQRMFQVNVIGLCIATREAVKDMRANNIDGHIIHINSITGHKVPNIPKLNVYPATKYAVTALTETLRLELVAQKSKIKISSISPGLVRTEIVDDPNLDTTGWPILESEDVTEAVKYVLSTPPHVQVHEIIIKPVGEAV